MNDFSCMNEYEIMALNSEHADERLISFTRGSLFLKLEAKK